MDQLHPGARWVFRTRAYSSLIIIGIFVTIWGSQFFFAVTGISLGVGLLIAVLFYILFVVLLAEVYARMSYNRYFYEITNDAIKKESGIIWKKYTSIPYERVQNVDIHRGIIARIFGFSSVQIETAGQSGFGGYGGFRMKGNRRYESEGYLPAISIDGAEKIREFVMKKIRKGRESSQGL